MINIKVVENIKFISLNKLGVETLKEYVCLQLPKPSTFSQRLNPLPHNSLILVDRIKSRAGCKRTKEQVPWK
ncbi:unnamed protein product [Lactuca virosa]|uniref:Uncharacterized protein n=1 Tax=Lactuca virosa TaxID=75947 RepID=A0AAU9MU84_9ASTR|nr:unnamed protein product [Lactuca virosa]